MSFNTVEEFDAAIESSYEEYEQHMLDSGQWLTFDQAYAIFESRTAKDFEDLYASLSYEDMSRGK
jgi:hypothetical protein